MKRIIKINFLFIAMCVLAFTACKESETSLDLPTAVSKNGAISVIPVKSMLGSTSTSTDSIYAIRAIVAGNRLTSITAAGLLPNINTYLTTNYPNYTFVKAFSTSLTTNNIINGYIVAITFNNKPVVLTFTNTVAAPSVFNFRSTLELREGEDLKNNRDHSIGGIFENRNASRRDSLGIADLSAAIRTYMSTNATRDTLRAAWKDRDGSIILLSKNVTFFSNTFTSAGAFIARTTIPSRSGGDVLLRAGASLPPSVETFFTLSYPKYIIGKAYYTAQNNVINGYVVVIDASLIKYAFVFNSTGALQSTTVLR
ncbi:hypothetical protein PBAC_27930 [Pedobacter glucosidilyticus]|nr:hypothetical protein [Pedobacter glucosidilyticus]KHJ37017.1 hypothetical protein PBAC_27930 [Pedobacter glucosidilyticus]